MIKPSLIASALVTLSVVTVQWVPAFAAPSSPSVSEYDGVKIKRNADGSLEVYDVDEPAAATQATSDPPLSTEASAATDVSSQPPVVSASDSLFAVKPVVSNRKPVKGTAVRTWSHGISAL